MAIGIQDILLARAQEDAERSNQIGTASTILGAGLGGTVGISVGDLQQRLAAGNKEKTMLGRAKPGYRMAGGLVGAILGGALGAGTKELMMANSPSAEILAKLQTQGDLDAADTEALQRILGDTYSSTLAM